MHLCNLLAWQLAASVGRTANPGKAALNDCSFAVMATGYHHLQAFPLVLLLSGATKHQRQPRFPKRRWSSELTNTGGSEATELGRGGTGC